MNAYSRRMALYLFTISIYLLGDLDIEDIAPGGAGIELRVRAQPLPPRPDRTLAIVLL